MTRSHRFRQRLSRRAEPAPAPGREPDARRVLEDVLGDGLEIGIAFDYEALEAALKEVSDAGVAPVEADRVQAVEPLHPGRELGLGRLDEQMEVVVEQDPDVDPPREAALHVGQQVEPRLPVGVVLDDRPLLDAAADDVVPAGLGSCERGIRGTRRG